MASGGFIVPLPMWVPGEHVLTVKSYSEPGEPEPLPQWALDVGARREVEAPFQPGHLRSHDGTYRIAPNGGDEGGYDLLQIIVGHQLTTYVHALAWPPDGRWLAATLQPLAEDGSNQGDEELAVFRMGPADA